jgi:hypothetical protein
MSNEAATNERRTRPIMIQLELLDGGEVTKSWDSGGGLSGGRD